METRFALASGTKGLTALTVVSLIEEGALGLSTTARSVLGENLPLIDEQVTVEHLLSHRSGIGDYCDEEEESPGLGGYPLAVPVQALDTTEAYLSAVDGFAAKFPPGERFSYCNSGFVVLALIAERSAADRFTTWFQSGFVFRRACTTPRSCDRTSCRRTPRPVMCWSTGCGVPTCSISRCVYLDRELTAS